MFLEVEEVLFAPVELRVVADPLDGDDALAGDERLVAAEVERVVHFGGIGGCLEVKFNLCEEEARREEEGGGGSTKRTTSPFGIFVRSTLVLSFLLQKPRYFSKK